MNLCRCEKGHFYDKEKYATCPHCGGDGDDSGVTNAFSGGDGSVTVPIQPAPPTVQKNFAGGAMTEEYSGNRNGGMPIAGFSSGDNTVSLDSREKVNKTIPLPGMDTPTEKLYDDRRPVDDDDDHTISFFDDDFFKPNKSDTPTTAPMPVANKVSTPCVGWLVALSGEHIGTDFRLKVGKNFIGRNLKNDIALTEDKSVSRDRHAIVVYEPKMHLYLVQPGEASTLVYLNNDVVLTPVKLQPYDMITVGDVNLLFMPLCGDRFNWGDLFEQMKKNK